MNNNNKGIDYGNGIVNIDLETGIRHGVIPTYAVQTWSDYSEAFYILECPTCSKDLDFELEACPHCNVAYPEGMLKFVEPSFFFYDADGYLCEQQADAIDIFILKSPYYTFCQYCSPCAPGAGYILNSLSNGIKTYCFGHDWFPELPTSKLLECPSCKGTGLRKKADIPNYIEENFKEYAFDDKFIKCWSCLDGWNTGSIGRIMEYKSSAPYPVYSVKTGRLIKP